MPAVFIFLILAIAALGVGLNFVGGPNCEKRIDAWATAQHFQVQSAVPTSIGGANPWGLWGTGRGTRFYQVTVLDASGGTRIGWVRIRAGWTIGGGRLDVRWEQ
jgi:hypothetical protein